MSSAKNSAGAPCTHQFLVTLTVQTTKINPTLTPPPRSATSLTNTYPLLGTPSDAQQMPSEPDRSVSFALVVGDEPRSVDAALRAPQRILDLLGMALYAVDDNGGVRQLFGRV
ncbi:hypothetical protein [Rhodococcus opacus]|uniref:hypothetical protein n=1 Tax=Rhodococcus opacus TaxID=37919 RepID=UPI001F590F26|nr:hypothetical protein [Rhodococcus opacus]UNN05030.1 hypothetical protein MOO23_39415 [Rhodococcus opacus]